MHKWNQKHNITITLYLWQVAVDNGMSRFSQAVLPPTAGCRASDGPYQLYQLHRRCFLHWKEIWVSSISNSTPRKTNMAPKNQWLEDVFPIEIVHF